MTVLFKRSLIAVAVILLLIASVYFIVGMRGEKSTITVGNLPWAVEITDSGNPSIFGLELGRSSINDFLDTHRATIDVRLFVDPDGKKNIEAYISKIRLGVFDASVILLPKVSEEQLQEHHAVAILKKPGPSGAFELQLPESNLNALLDYPLGGLIYIPKVQYSEDEVITRFGKPDQKIQLNDTKTLWSYSDKSYFLTHDSEEREQIYYIEQSQYRASMNKILSSYKEQD